MKKIELLKRIEAIERHLGFSSEPSIASLLETGRWYKHCGNGDVIFNLGNGAGYGFHNTFWTNQKEGFFNFDHCPEQWTPATIDIVADLLEHEARRRGYVNGVIFNHSKLGPIYAEYDQVIKGEKFWLENQTILCFGDMKFVIFKDGLWADIVSRVPQVGDICKFWDADDSFIIGKLAKIHFNCINDSGSYPYMLTNGAEYKYAKVVTIEDLAELLFGKEK